MADDTYISLPVAADYDETVAGALDYLAAKIPGYVPREGHLEVWLIEVITRMVVELTSVATRVPPTIFRYFGESLLAIPAIDAARARMPSTWVLRDSLGHTISAGTVVAYQQAADRQVYFTVESDVIVAPGISTTSTGEVTLVALESGSAANGLLAGPMQVVDALAWVDQITTTAVSSGGVDGETDDEYLDRLRSELRLLTPRPILPEDFAVLARRIGGVDRAKAIEGYNPSTATYGNERMVTVALADEDGNAVATSVKNEVAAYLDGLREVNFSVHVIDPNYQTVNVVAAVAKVSTAVASEVEAACEAALADYLDPAAWEWTSTVRRNELIALLDRVEGVDYVVNVSQPAADVVMTGPAPLAVAGTTAVSVT